MGSGPLLGDMRGWRWLRRERDAIECLRRRQVSWKNSSFPQCLDRGGRVGLGW